MKFYNNRIIFSPSDLSAHISCKHLTQLNRKLALGEVKEPKPIANRALSMLKERGKLFETEYLKIQKDKGLRVAEISTDDSNAETATIESMKSGADIIYQARLIEHGQWSGWADFLIKTSTPSKLGDWSYEVWDTKLATETRAGTILQIALYTEKVASIQGATPEYMGVIKPDGEVKFRYNEYAAYVRLIKKRLVQDLQKAIDTYPEPVEHCDICKWWSECNKRRRADDHLSFIAGMGSSQIKEVKLHGVNTLKEMAELNLPVPFKPSRGAVETYNKLREQARVQYESRVKDYTTIYETLEVIPEIGLNRLPEPSKNDIYLDLEGDPLIEPNGLEYLIGYVYKGKYTSFWAENEQAEKDAFEKFVDFAFKIKQEDPTMHIYHYAPYEVVAFKRLMGKYATRSDEIDFFLRSATFVDLYAVVRQSIRASVEKYSIKDLEKFFGYEREMDLRALSGFKAEYEYLLEIKEAASATREMKDAIQLYNQDDCVSTHRLHIWLEKIRTQLIKEGNILTRPLIAAGEASENITEFQQMIKPIYDALLDKVPASFDERTEEQKAKFILAHMLDWYAREDKSYWWEYFRLLNLSEDEALDEPKALSYLSYDTEVKIDEKTITQTCHFPIQDCDFRLGDSLIFKINNAGSNKIETKVFGKIIELKSDSNKVVIQKGKYAYGLNADILFLIEDHIKTEKKRDAIVAFSKDIVDNGFNSSFNKCGVDLLMRVTPRVSKVVNKNNDLLEKTKDWALKLNNSVLPVQGPPGSGKSYTASHVILELIRKGNKIGVTALSNKVITNLLEKTHQLAIKNKMDIKIIQKVSSYFNDPVRWDTCSKSDSIESKLTQYNLVGGTSFFFCLPGFYKKFDYLIVDEAGQLSLIDTLAVSQSARNLLLLGDPQQLKQPLKGVHPEGTEVSALEHILQGNKTIDSKQGVFLNNTYRMHPAICSFDSEMFYEDKLQAIPGLENQQVSGKTKYAGSGLYFEEMTHNGNTNASTEEVEKIAEIVAELTKKDVFWIDEKNKQHALTYNDIKIISPYNAQVNALKEKLPDVSVGTVDKFQGQEAPVIIYSIATSTPQDAPRGMDFLYSPNRFNVAVSRAKARFIMVANKQIFEPECKSPYQIKLANPFCRFIEMKS